MPDISGGISGTGNLYAGVSGGNNPAAVPVGGAFQGVQAPPAPSGIVTAGYPSGTAITGSTALTPAIQAIWSKEILFQAMPILRFEQFAVVLVRDRSPVGDEDERCAVRHRADDIRPSRRWPGRRAGARPASP